MSTAYISIGSNIAKEDNIRSALKLFQENYGKIQCSSIYESEPVGFLGDNFFNLIVAFETENSAETLYRQLKDIEITHGRCKESKKFSARTLDLDLILLGDQIINAGRIQIPRNDILEYAFVLEPLAEIDPMGKHPVSGQCYQDLWQNFDKRNIKQKRLTLNLSPNV